MLKLFPDRIHSGLDIIGYIFRESTEVTVTKTINKPPVTQRRITDTITVTAGAGLTVTVTGGAGKTITVTTTETLNMVDPITQKTITDTVPVADFNVLLPWRTR